MNHNMLGGKVSNTFARAGANKRAYNIWQTFPPFRCGNRIRMHHFARQQKFAD
jgi:hypothetical protein